MSSGKCTKLCGTTEERNEVLKRFKSGYSKAEIGRAIGRDKAQVTKMLAQAIREQSTQ